MNTKVNKAYFLIPVFYAAIIIFLLYMQFSGTKSFSAEIQDITIEGKTHSGAPGSGSVISDLSVRSNGLLFSFGEDNPILVFTQDGLTHRVKPEEYRVTASGIDIRVEKNILVSFYHSRNDANNLHISLNAQDPESIKYIRIPVSGSDATLEKMESAPVVSVKSEVSGNFFLNLPESAEYSSENRSIIIYPDSSGPAEMVLEKTAGSGLDAFNYWAAGRPDLISAEALAALIENYIGRAAAGLTGDRFNPARGTWAAGDGSTGFYEDALVMAAAENLGTTSYRSVYDMMSRAAASHSRELTLLSSPLFGNIVNECWSYDEDIKKTIDRLARMAESKDYSVFGQPALMTAVVTEDSRNLIQNLVSMTETFPDTGLETGDALALLAFYSSLSEIAPSTAVRFEGAVDTVQAYILPSVKLLGDRIYIADADGNADIGLSLRAGLLLMNLSGIGKSEVIGRELVNSALLLSDEFGFLPEKVSFSDSGEPSREGTIRPETVYPYFKASDYYPGFDYYLSDTGERLAVLNQAKDFRIANTDFGYRLDFDFPAGQTHTFAIRNLKPFYQIHLLGYKWNSDHRFLNYSSGWWYDRQHNTLFIKIRHRTEHEEVLIYTRQPPEPPASAEPAATKETPAAETPAAAPAADEGQKTAGEGL